MAFTPEQKKLHRKNPEVKKRTSEYNSMYRVKIGLQPFAKMMPRRWLMDGRLRWRLPKSWVTKGVNTSSVLRKSKKLKAVEFAGGKCCMCGYNKCVEALDFHHLDPSSKRVGPRAGGTLMHQGWSFVLEEIKKCILVCANCHREIHFGLVDLSQYSK
jgi:hypothetical protein